MTNDTDLSRRRLRTWIRLLRMTRGAENHLREFLRVNHNSTLPRFDVMAALARKGAPMKMSALSRELLVSNGNATAVVERLEKDGLAKRTPSSDDRRVVMVNLTDKGRAEFDTLAKAHEAEIDRYFAALGENELDTIRDMMKRIEGANDDKDG